VACDFQAARGPPLQANGTFLGQFLHGNPGVQIAPGLGPGNVPRHPVSGTRSLRYTAGGLQFSGRAWSPPTGKWRVFRAVFAQQPRGKDGARAWTMRSTQARGFGNAVFEADCRWPVIFRPHVVPPYRQTARFLGDFCAAAPG